jgi:nitrogen fixation protein NifU and related proteins
MAYSDKVIDHYENPRNVGSLDKSDDNVGTGLVGAPACGDVMKLQLRVSDDGIIEDAKFKTFGCGSAIASSSLVTEWVKGKSIHEAEGLKNSQIAEELALPPVKIHCSVLAEEAVKAAIYDYKLKKGLLSVADVYDHEKKMAGANRGEGESDADVDTRVKATVAAYATRHGLAIASVLPLSA